MQTIFKMMIRIIRLVIRKLGYDVVRYSSSKVNRFPIDFEKQYIEIIEKVSPYTITSPERVHALIESVKFIVRNDIKGSFLECGVYKGGSMMAVALTLLKEGIKDRELYLFDTFAGMPEPTQRDIDAWGTPAIDEYSQKRISKESSMWMNATLDDVKGAMALTGYPIDRIHFVKGLVEDTIPDKIPNPIAFLRLDTDWYESIKHELIHLYPLISPKGVIIVDDYGHYKGTREAVDEYFSENNITSFLHRIDYTGRLIIKDE